LHIHPFFQFNVEANLLLMNVAVAPNLARPVAILFKIVQQKDVKDGVTRRIEPLIDADSQG
jgi:hypothetical protein